MTKRKRSVGCTNVESQFECPVCLTEGNPVFTFDCGHGVCKSCDSELFCRADDRCPTCRASRLPESIDENMNSDEFLRRRQVALAQREGERSRSGVVFFPRAAVIEINASDFNAVDDASGPEEERRDARFTRRRLDPLDSRVEDVVNALLNAESMPLSEFFVTVAAFRSRRRDPRPAHVQT